MKKISLVLWMLVWGLAAIGQQAPKREFRGVWIASVANIDWPSRPDLTNEKQRQEFRTLLNEHKKYGINAVIVQVRPSADAFYRSAFEPWSEWLTGQKGKAPDPEYDPLTFMVEEAHERGMEFHAWLNPYRAIFDTKRFYNDSTHIVLDSLCQIMNEMAESDSANTSGRLSAAEYAQLTSLLNLDTTLLVYKHPDWFLQYGNKIYFDPGIPAVQQHIANVIRDMISHYDVDAIHMDDYFYPYRIAGVEFPDSLSFRKYGSQFSRQDKDDWRRENVNTIVRMIHETIRNTKPYVKFGISPFGVWRNASKDSMGSDTQAGQTNYDDLFADVLKWQKEKWIDYVIPQIYWYRGFKVADYNILAKWWNDHSYGVQVYIGQGLYRVNADSKSEAWRNPQEIPEQIVLNRSLPNIHGSCFFSSRSVINNPLGVSDILREQYYNHPALPPVMPWLDNTALASPNIESVKNSGPGFLVSWQGHQGDAYYVVYRFKGRRKGDFNDPANILSIQRNTASFYIDHSIKRFRRYTYAITSLDRLFNESAPGKTFTTRWKKLKNP